MRQLYFKIRSPGTNCNVLPAGMECANECGANVVVYVSDPHDPTRQVLDPTHPDVCYSGTKKGRYVGALVTSLIKSEFKNPEWCFHVEYDETAVLDNQGQPGGQITECDICDPECLSCNVQAKLGGSGATITSFAVMDTDLVITTSDGTFPVPIKDLWPTLKTCIEAGTNITFGEGENGELIINSTGGGSGDCASVITCIEDDLAKGTTLYTVTLDGLCFGDVIVNGGPNFTIDDVTGTDEANLAANLNALSNPDYLFSAGTDPNEICFEYYGDGVPESVSDCTSQTLKPVTTKVEGSILCPLINDCVTLNCDEVAACVEADILRGSGSDPVYTVILDGFCFGDITFDDDTVQTINDVTGTDNTDLSNNLNALALPGYNFTPGTDPNEICWSYSGPGVPVTVNDCSTDPATQKPVTVKTPGVEPSVVCAAIRDCLFAFDSCNGVTLKNASGEEIDITGGSKYFPLSPAIQVFNATGAVFAPGNKDNDVINLETALGARLDGKIPSASCIGAIQVLVNVDISGKAATGTTADLTATIGSVTASADVGPEANVDEDAKNRFQGITPVNPLSISWSVDNNGDSNVNPGTCFINIIGVWTNLGATI